MSLLTTKQRYTVLAALDQAGGRCTSQQFIEKIRAVGAEEFDEPDSAFLPEPLTNILSEYKAEGYIRVEKTGELALTEKGGEQLDLLRYLTFERVAAIA